MGKPIWFPFFVNDFLSSGKVAVMTTEEVGAYVFLLSYEWQDPTCSLPSDDDSLQKLGRFSGDLTRLRACFTVKRGRLVNERLYNEWIKVNAFKEICSISGKNGANARWPQRVTGTDTPPVTGTEHSSPSPSQSQSQSQKNQDPSPSPSEKEIKASRDGVSTARPPKSDATWKAYSGAYDSRYRATPVRNAKVNAQLCRVVDTLGVDEAPQVAAFYLSHNDPFYVRKRHPVGLLLQDAEGLRTQWATGVKATSGEARNAELKDEVREQVKRVQTMMGGTTP